MARRTLLILTDDGGLETRLPVTGLDPLAFDLLLEDHLPRQGVKEPWNEATFPPALIARCTGLTEDAAERLWNQGEVDEAEEVLEACVRLSMPGEWDWAKRRLQREPRLALELRLCLRLGISHSHYLGGPQVWTDRDRDLALAALETELDRCPGCRIPAADMDDPAAGAIDGTRCIHCQQLHHAQAEIPDPDKPGVHLFVRPVPPDEREG